MPITDDAPAFERQGFLKEDFRLFHLKDKVSPCYEFHYHDFLKIMVLLEGKVNYVIEGRSYSLHPFDIVLVGRGQIHRPEVDSGQPYERQILYLSQDFLDRHRENEDSLDRCFATAAYRHSNVLRLKKEVRANMLSLLKQLERSQNWQQEEFAGPLMSRLLCQEFLVELNRASMDDKAQYLPTGVLNYRVSGLISYINEHLDEDLSIGTLSSLSCISPYHMMRIFKEETGCTIGNYITEKRLIYARDLLGEGVNATDACFRSGFSHYSTFLRAYKNHFQQLPKRNPGTKI